MRVGLELFAKYWVIRRQTRTVCDDWWDSGGKGEIAHFDAASCQLVEGELTFARGSRGEVG